MKNIGLLVAVEIDAVLEDFGDLVCKQNLYGFNVFDYQMDDCVVHVIHSGAGQLAAAAATSLLISCLKVEAVFNFGVVGGLTEEMKLAKSCFVERVVHYEYDTSALDHCEVGRYLEYPSIYIPVNQHFLDVATKLYPDLKHVTCASGDKFVDGAQRKTELHQLFDADICEMEAAAIVLTCNRANIPCLIVKTVSDAITGGAEDFANNCNATGKVCLSIMKNIIEELR